MRYKLTVAYDGSNYYGFQRQIKEVTVEEKLNEALFKIYKKPIKVVASGRTDRGVHALAQVVHFDTNIVIAKERLLKALNRSLPLDIRAIDVKVVDDNFHARFDAVKKTYRYVISSSYNLFERNYETYIGYPLNISKMEEGLKLFIGTHDYFGFTTYLKDKPTIKTIYNADLVLENNKIVITFTGDSFLRYMVRKMVGTLIDIGLGKKDPEIITTVFNTKDSSLCSKTASPNGLYLVEVFYS